MRVSRTKFTREYRGRNVPKGRFKKDVQGEISDISLNRGGGDLVDSNIGNGKGGGTGVKKIMDNLVLNRPLGRE